MMDPSSGATMSDQQALHFVVIVLGDLGRSPRMQYHALSLLQHGHCVSFLGYHGEDLIPSLLEHEKLNVIKMNTSTPILLKKTKIMLPIYYLWRITSLVLKLMWSFWTISKQRSVDCVLVQNPPAVPLLLVSFLYCKVMGSCTNKRPGLVVDWHNLGYSMFSSGSLFGRVTRMYEKQMAPRANGHLCVTSAMKEFLVSGFLKGKSDNISVLYDCPPTMFRPLSTSEQHEFQVELLPSLLRNQSLAGLHLSTNSKQTFFTKKDENGIVQPRPSRPALVVSSTSWTPDEDFGLFLDALVHLDELINKRSSLKVIVIVTGKGPLKQHYEELISKLNLQHVWVMTLWLKHGDYPRLLACADVGISLHTSTSGLDLPMKILDLFGCHVPVLARDFECLPELVQDKVNGRVFETSTQLADQLYTLLEPLGTASAGLPPHGYGELQRYSRNLKGRRQWNENWNEHALLVLLEACSHNTNARD